jgi:hypothetical protein
VYTVMKVGFHKMLGISSLAEELITQEEIYSMELVTKIISF